MRNRACLQTLQLLGFRIISYKDGVLVAKRKFYPAIFCGSGGETIIIHYLDKKTFTVHSYKTFPYPSATHFFIDDFITQYEKIINNT
jgi:hypothetical protein